MTEVDDRLQRIEDLLRAQNVDPESLPLKVEYRSLLPEFFVVTLGSRNFSRDDFDTLIPYEKPLVETRKKTPTMDGVRSMLPYSNPQYRALIGVFANIGWRIEEILSRKWS